MKLTKAVSLLTIMVNTIFMSFETYAKNMNYLFNSEYLHCFPMEQDQHNTYIQNSSWEGYSILLKKLNSGKVFGTFQGSYYQQGKSYSPLFELEVDAFNKNDVIYLNIEYGINLNAGWDSSIGGIVAVAYNPKSEYESTALFCFKYNSAVVENLLQKNDLIDKKNMRKLIETND